MANETNTPAANITFIGDMTDADLDALLGMDEWTAEDEAAAVDADTASYAAKVAAISDAPAYDLNETAFAALSTAGHLSGGRAVAACNLARAGFLTRTNCGDPWTRTPEGDALLAAQ